MTDQGRVDPLIVGFTEVDAAVTGPSGSSRALRLLVDSGAKYTVLPHDVWSSVFRRSGPATFVLADSTHIERWISECRILNPFSRTLQRARMLLARVA